MKRQQKYYLALELNPRDNAPRIIGLFSTRAAAEEAAYAPGIRWGSVIELPLQG